jgi:hypothetical protein
VNLDLTDNQLAQLVKVAEKLPRDQQKMLVQILSEKMNTRGAASTSLIGSASSPHIGTYKNLYHKLMDTFKKAKVAINPTGLGGKVAVLPKTMQESEGHLKQ